MIYDVVLTESVHKQACDHLLQHVRLHKLQEDVCFGLWQPSTGLNRQSALVYKIVLPRKGERKLSKFTKFSPEYLTRVIKIACSSNAGLVFMHNHLSDGWQNLSKLDTIAERDRIAPPSRVCGLPLVGLTLGTDGAWSARYWVREEKKTKLIWCNKVRVVGQRLKVTFNDELMPPPKRRKLLTRTADTWGEEYQSKIARLKMGVIGTGSVGCIVAEALARMGISNLILVDPDRIESHNLDRLLYAGKSDIGKFKTEFVAQCLENSATSDSFKVETYPYSIQQETAYRAALDCDILFSAVDKPLPKDLLNRIAYSHCIPVISGGIRIENKKSSLLSNALWSITVVGPGKQCLRCNGQYSSSDVITEIDGSLEDPMYIQQSSDSEFPRNQNVFTFCANIASFMVIEMIRLLIAETWWPNVGNRMSYSFIPGQLSFTQEYCGENCSISGNLAIGDQFRYPFII